MLGPLGFHFPAGKGSSCRSIGYGNMKENSWAVCLLLTARVCLCLLVEVFRSTPNLYPVFAMIWPLPKAWAGKSKSASMLFTLHHGESKEPSG